MLSDYYKRMCVCRFKFSSLFIAGWILIGCQCLYRSSAGIFFSENYSIDMVSLCLYRYSCGVEWTLLGIFIVIVLGLNGALLTLMMFQNYWLLKIALNNDKCHFSSTHVIEQN